jgi:hypothetical protein
VKPPATAARAAFSLVIALAIASASSAGGRAARVAEFVPDPGAAGAPRLEDATWRAEAPGYAAELTLLDEAARLAFVKRRLGSAEDPFAPLPGATSTLLTFLLRIENRGKGDLVFESDGTRLVGRNRDEWHPVGWPDIQSAYDLLGREVPAPQTRARELLIDGQKVVPAGRPVEGILVFRAPPAGTKRFRLEVSLTLPDGSAAGFGAPYRVVRP